MTYKLDKLKTDFGISYYQCGEEHPQVVFVHGLFGSGRNFGTFLRLLANDFSCAAIDQRGHGESDHFQDKGELQPLIEDLAKFLQKTASTSTILIGHSLGGKVVIRLSSQYPSLVSKLMVVDTGIEPLGKDVLVPLKWMLDMPTPIASRKAAAEYMTQFTKEQSLINFLLTNLKSTEEGWRWRIDLKGLEQLIKSMFAISLEVDWGKITCPTYLVRGEKSTHFTVEQAEKMKKQNVTLTTIANAGHWCHAEQPEQFGSILKKFIAE